MSRKAPTPPPPAEKKPPAPPPPPQLDSPRLKAARAADHRAEEKQNRYLRRGDCLALAVELYARGALSTERARETAESITEVAAIFEAWLMEDVEDEHPPEA